MGHDQCGAGTKFDREIAVANGIERVLADFFKSQQLGDQLAINRVRCSCKSRRTEWKAVNPCAAIMHAFGVPAQLLDIGHEVVAKSHWLRDLQVRKSRHHRVDVLLGQVNKGSL